MVNVRTATAFTGKRDDMNVTKSPGHDWLITAEYEDGETNEVSVFGQIRIEDAVKEARLSFEASVVFGAEPMPYAIISAERIK